MHISQFQPMEIYYSPFTGLVKTKFIGKRYNLRKPGVTLWKVVKKLDQGAKQNILKWRLSLFFL